MKSKPIQHPNTMKPSALGVREVRMKGQELLKIASVLQALDDVPMAPELAEGLCMQKTLIQAPLAEVLVVIQAQAPDSVRTFETSRKALCDEFSKKNPDGTPQHDGRDYIMDETRKELFDKAYADLKESMPDAAKLMDERAAARREVLDREFLVPLLKINIRSVRSITPAQFTLLRFFFHEPQA